MDYVYWLAMIVPMFIVYAIGITLALANLRRHPRPATLVLIACGTMFVVNAASQILFLYALRSVGMGFLRSYAYLVVTFATTVILASGWLVVLAAVFPGRREPEPQENAPTALPGNPLG